MSAPPSPLSASSSLASTPTSSPIMRNAKLAPFLKKLQGVIGKTPTAVADWSENGEQYNVLKPDRFAHLIQTTCKLTAKAFARQLNYYGLTTIPAKNGGGDGVTKGSYSIRHPQLLRDEQAKLVRSSKDIASFSASSSSEMDEDEEYDPISPLDPTSTISTLQKTLRFFESKMIELCHKVEMMQRVIDESSNNQPQARIAHDDFDFIPLFGDVEMDLSIRGGGGGAGGSVIPLPHHVGTTTDVGVPWPILDVDGISFSGTASSSSSNSSSSSSSATNSGRSLDSCLTQFDSAATAAIEISDDTTTLVKDDWDPFFGAKDYSFV